MAGTKRKSAKKSPARAGAKAALVLFAPAAVQRLEAKATLPAKFQRMLDRLPLKRVCKDATVAVKIHVGGHLGFTTIPPLFVRILVQKVKDAGARPPPAATRPRSSAPPSSAPPASRTSSSTPTRSPTRRSKPSRCAATSRTPTP